METRFLLMSFLSRLSGIRQISQNPSTLGKGDQLGEGLDLQLLHHPVAMGLDRAFGRAQYVGDLLVGLAANDKIEDLALARRQRRDMSTHDVKLASLAARCLMVSQSPFNCTKKLL
jgi:hypothetical protein